MLPLARFRVVDRSMQPAFNPDDFVLINRWAYFLSPPKEGDVVLVQDPQHNQRLLLKRILRASNNGYWVQGDNRNASRDSRAFGPLPKHFILGKVIWHIKKN